MAPFLTVIQTPYINVMQYGAVGNGIVDDTLAIQNAISAATRQSAAGTPGNGGGTVYFPPGVYLHRGLTIYNFIHLLGAGIEASILMLKVGSTTDSIITYRFAALTGTNTYVTSCNNWSIRDLTIDGNWKTNLTGTGTIQQFNVNYGVRAYGYGFIVDSIRIRNHSGGGWYSEWSDHGTTLGVLDSMEAQVSKVKVHDVGLIGFNAQGPHDSSFSEIICWYTGSHNFLFGVNATGALVDKCHGWASGSIMANSVAYLIEAPVSSFMNCAAESSSTVQVVVLATSKFVWSGGAIFAGGVANTSGMQLGQASGKTTPFYGSSFQSGGVTTQCWVTTFNINTNFDKLQGPLGTIYCEADGGSGLITGTVYYDETVDWHSYTSVINGPSLITNPGYSISGYNHSTQIMLSPKVSYAGQDGSVSKGGWIHLVCHGFKALTLGDGSTDLFNFNTWYGPVPRCEFVNGCEIRTYTDNYGTPSFRASHGKFGILESTTASVIATGGTITTQAIGVARVAPAANVTGVILQPGTTEATAMGGGGLFLTVQNESAFALTFAAVGTSFVASGTACVIAANSSALFQWSTRALAGVGAWFRVGQG